MTTSTPRTRDFLSRLPLFNELAPADLDHIAQSTAEVEVGRGKMVFHRGEPCVGFHAVVYGQIKLALVSPEGAEKVVRIIGPGESFGEALMFMEKPYIVSAQALSDSLLLHIPKDAVFAGIERGPQLAYKMLGGLSARLHGLMRDVEAYTLHSGTQRVIGYLLGGGLVKEGEPFRLEVSKAVIASRLSLTPEHFSRILHDLGARGLISVNGRQITLRDIGRLRDYNG